MDYQFRNEYTNLNIFQKCVFSIREVFIWHKHNEDLDNITLYFNIAYNSIVNTPNKTKNNLIYITGDESSDDEQIYRTKYLKRKKA